MDEIVQPKRAAKIHSMYEEDSVSDVTQASSVTMDEFSSDLENEAKENPKDSQGRKLPKHSHPTCRSGRQVNRDTHYNMQIHPQVSVSPHYRYDTYIDLPLGFGSQALGGHCPDWRVCW